MRLFLLVCATAFALLSLPAMAAMAPHISITSLSELDVPDRPFNESANANAEVDAAFARAKKSGKDVMIDLGGNWCADCRIMSGLMELPEMHAFLAKHYEMATVDVGRFNKNLQIPARFGITTRLEGVPAFLIATPDGELVNAGHVSAIEDARHLSPQALADWLAQWTK